MTPEERQRIEAIRKYWWNIPDVLWLLDLVERQEAELRAIENGRKGVTSR